MKSASSVDINWLKPKDVVIADAYLANWLLDTKSLTERLQSMCRSFEVEVISHQLISPKADEIALLNCAADNTIVREVLLSGDGVPWVFARSVIPKTINDTELKGLGSQPLGVRIFNDPRFSRGAFQLCELEWESIQPRLEARVQRSILGRGENNPRNVLGRRSCFDFLGDKMSVAELFLPASPAYSNLR